MATGEFTERAAPRSWTSRPRRSAESAAQGDKVPVILRVDVEPDGLFIDRSVSAAWKGYEGAFAFFQSARDRMATATKAPVHLSWFFRMDPQIEEAYGSAEWAAAHYAAYLPWYTDNGDDVGLHTHAYRWIAEHGRWSLDHANQDWVDHCVRTAFAAFRKVFGRDCASFSFGDRWMSDRTLALVEELGARYELTMEPGYEERPSFHMDELYSGFLPAYTDVPRHPYRPSRRDFRIADPSRRDGIWMIPMTTGSFPLDLVRLLYYTVRRIRLRKSTVRTLNPSQDCTTFQTIVQQNLGSPYLCMVVRADAFAKPTLLNNVRANLAWFLARADIERFRFSTAAEALQQLGLG